MRPKGGTLCHDTANGSPQIPFAGVGLNDRAVPWALEAPLFIRMENGRAKLDGEGRGKGTKAMSMPLARGSGSGATSLGGHTFSYGPVTLLLRATPMAYLGDVKPLAL